MLRLVLTPCHISLDSVNERLFDIVMFCIAGDVAYVGLVLLI